MVGQGRGARGVGRLPPSAACRTVPLLASVNPKGTCSPFSGMDMLSLRNGQVSAPSRRYKYVVYIRSYLVSWTAVVGCMLLLHVQQILFCFRLTPDDGCIHTRPPVEGGEVSCNNITIFNRCYISVAVVRSLLHSSRLGTCSGVRPQLQLDRAVSALTALRHATSDATTGLRQHHSATFHYFRCSPT